jgi:hypothetical protein
MRKRVITVTITCAVAMTACGGPSTQAVHGQVVGGTQAAATVFAANGAAGICAGAVEGTQVIVKGPSGTLLTTTTLHKDAKASSALGVPASLSSGQVGVYEFSATIPAGSGVRAFGHADLDRLAHTDAGRADRILHACEMEKQQIRGHSSGRIRFLNRRHWPRRGWLCDLVATSASQCSGRGCGIVHGAGCVRQRCNPNTSKAGYSSKVHRAYWRARQAACVMAPQFGTHDACAAACASGPPSRARRRLAHAGARGRSRRAVALAEVVAGFALVSVAS